MARPPLTDRLLARNAGSGLTRRSMADGGEVYSGALAQRVLKTVGARALTYEGKILVGNDFNANNAEHAAVYAHERLHERTSGGRDIHGAHDAEEVSARAIERMVLHQIQAGHDIASVLRDAAAGKLKEAAATALGGVPTDKQAGSWMGYVALRAQGKPHHQIVRELADAIVRKFDQEENLHRDRTTELASV